MNPPLPFRPLRGSGRQACVRRRAASRIASWLAALVLALPAHGQPAPLDGRWVSEGGDVIELRTGPKGTVGRLAAGSESGLGMYFKPGDTIVQVERDSSGALTWTVVQEARAKVAEDTSARTADYLVLAGAATAQPDPDGLGCTLTWQPVRERHTSNRDRWHLGSRTIDPVPPPLVLKLRRGPELTVFLVRSEEVLEPVAALHHGLTYVAEFVSFDRSLPDRVPLTVQVAGESLAVEAALIERGVGSRYRSRPFTLIPRTDGLPLP